MNRRSLYRKWIAFCEMLLGVATVLGSSTALSYMVGDLDVPFGFMTIILGLVAYGFWDTHYYILLTLPLAVYNLAIAIYTIDHKGSGMTGTIISMCLYVIIVLETNYDGLLTDGKQARRSNPRTQARR